MKVYHRVVCFGGVFRFTTSIKFYAPARPDSARVFRVGGLTRDGMAKPVSRDQIFKRERGQGR